MIEPLFSPYAISILESCYLKRDADGRVCETPAQMLARVAKYVSGVDSDLYGISAGDTDKLCEDFYELMAGKLFMPNSPALMNAGMPGQQLSACFVLPVDDNLEAIFDAIKYTALIHRSGGGTGFDFSRLRPRSDIVRTTGGVASGPVSFMRVFNCATEEIRQGGRRRGANMGIMRVDHPDIMEFIICKDQDGVLRNFNISVAITDRFLSAYKSDTDYELINPRTGKDSGKLNARYVFNKICAQAWKNGEPGIIFIDRINARNPIPLAGRIESTNPCGEQPLLPYESCVLGSINLEKFVSGKDYDYEKLRITVFKAVHFLDNIIDANVYPLEIISKTTKSNRKIGLGVMGFANSLILSDICYDSDEAVCRARKVMKFLHTAAIQASSELALLRGSFPNHDKSIYKQPMRNATVTTIAPTGTISILCDTSQGIEPVFGSSFYSNRAGIEMFETNPLYSYVVDKYGATDQDRIRKLFKSGTEIPASGHISIQAAFQEFTDNAVSKTVNLPETASLESVHDAFITAYEKGCKGITVYRYGSRKDQVFSHSGEKVCRIDLENTAECCEG